MSASGECAGDELDPGYSSDNGSVDMNATVVPDSSSMFSSQEDIQEHIQEHPSKDPWDFTALDDSIAAPEVDKSIDDEELVELSDREEPIVDDDLFALSDTEEAAKKSKGPKKDVSFCVKVIEESGKTQKKKAPKRAASDRKGDPGAKRSKKPTCLQSLILSDDSEDDMPRPLSQRSANSSDAPTPARTHNRSITEFMTQKRKSGETSRNYTPSKGPIKSETLETPIRSQVVRKLPMTRTPPALAAAKSSSHARLKASVKKEPAIPYFPSSQSKEEKEEKEAEAVKTTIRQELRIRRTVSSFPIASLVMDSFLRCVNDDHVRHIQKNIRSMAPDALILEGYEAGDGKIRITNGNHRLQAMLNVNKKVGKDIFSDILVAVHPVSLKTSRFSSILFDNRLPHTAIEKVLHVNEFLDAYDVNRRWPKVVIQKIVHESLWQCEYSLRTVNFARLLTKPMCDMLMDLRGDELFNRRNMLNMYMSAYTRDRTASNSIIQKYSILSPTLAPGDRPAELKKLREALGKVEPSVFDALTDEGLRMKPPYGRDEANILVERFRGVKGAAESVRKIRRNIRNRLPLATMEKDVRADTAAKRHNQAVFREVTCQSTTSPIHFIDFEVLASPVKRRLYFEKLRYDHVVIVFGGGMENDDAATIFREIQENVVYLNFFGVEHEEDGMQSMLMPVAFFVWQGTRFLDNEEAIDWCRDGGLKKEITIQDLQRIFPSSSYFFSGTSDTICDAAGLVNKRGNQIEWDTDEDPGGEMLLKLTGRTRTATQLNSQQTQLPGAKDGEGQVNDEGGDHEEGEEGEEIVGQVRSDEEMEE